MAVKIGTPDTTFACFCCGATFVFTIESGGLCDACNDGNCTACGGDDEAEDPY